MQGCIAGYVLCRVNCTSLFCFLHFGRYVTDISVWIVLIFYMCCLFVCSKIFPGLIWNYLFKLYIRFTGAKICVHFTRRAQCVSVCIRQTHVSIVHLNTLCVLYTLYVKHHLYPICTYKQPVKFVQEITTLCCENNTKIINIHCGKNVDPRSLKRVVAYIQLPLSCSG
jgi:hypothetical protein